MRGMPALQSRLTLGHSSASVPVAPLDLLLPECWMDKCRLGALEAACKREYNRRIIESQTGLGWKGPFKGHLVQAPAMSRDLFNWIMLLRVPSNLALNIARGGASTTSLGNLGQCLITLIAKDFFLISSLNLLF